ncbi:MAG: type II secretion system protein [Fervidobacterium sp.]
MVNGFTLIELLVTLAVISLLMLVATALVFSAYRDVQANQVAQNFKNLKTAIDVYFATVHELPKARYASSTVLTDYVSHLPSGYEIIFDTAFNVDNTAAATIIYTGGNAKFADISKDNPEVHQLTVDAYTELPGVEIRIMKW